MGSCAHSRVDGGAARRQRYLAQEYHRGWPAQARSKYRPARRHGAFGPIVSGRIVLGHGHWDAAGQIDSFPSATLDIQAEELSQIKFFLQYPGLQSEGDPALVARLEWARGFRLELYPFR